MAIEDKFKDFTHYIAFCHRDDDDPEGSFEVFHIIGYPEEPSEEVINNFKEEVRTDKEFGIGDLVDKLEIKVLDKEIGFKITMDLISEGAEGE